jgi:hypothetical protein
MIRVSWSPVVTMTAGLSLLLAQPGAAAEQNAAEKDAAERGAEAVRGKPSMNPSLWSLKAREQVWKVWA